MLVTEDQIRGTQRSSPYILETHSENDDGNIKRTELGIKSTTDDDFAVLSTSPITDYVI